MPRPKSKGTDQRLTTAWWRKTVRGHWQKPENRQPCTRCHQDIDYDGPRYIPNQIPRKVNPRSLVVGHIISRHQAKLLGWTDEQTMAIANSRPECADCSSRSGAIYLNALLGRTPTPTTHGYTINIRNW